MYSTVFGESPVPKMEKVMVIKCTFQTAINNEFLASVAVTYLHLSSLRKRQNTSITDELPSSQVYF